jgi:Stress responsive A/B Barrel Domain
MSMILRSLLVLAMTAVMCGAADKQIHHMVMFTWKDGTTAEQAAAIEKALTGLKTKIPGIVSLTYGKQVSKEDAAQKHGFQYGLSVVFANAAARDVYLTHNEHVLAVSVLLPHLGDVAVLDYEL